MNALRRTALFLAALLILLAVTACAAGDHGLSPSHPVQLTIWHYYNGTQKELFDQMVDQFNQTVGAQKGIIISAQSQGGVNDLQNAVRDAVDGKVGAQEAPDIFAAYADIAYAFNQEGRLADLAQYMTEEEIAAYMDSYVEEGRLSEEKSFKIFPIAKSTEFLCVNKTVWDAFAQETGVAADQLLTWEGVSEVAAIYYDWTNAKTEAPDDGKAFFGRDDLANYLIVGAKQLGKELFRVENGQVTYQLDRQVLRRLWDQHYVPYVKGYFTADGRFRSDDAKTGALIAYVGSTSSATYFPSVVTDDAGTETPIEGMVLPLPNFAGTEPYAVQQGAGMVVMKSDQAREYAATLFLKWFTQTENNIQYSIQTGYLPVTKEGNDADGVRRVMEDQGRNPDGLSERAVLQGLNITGSYTLYTSAPFAYGNEARMAVGNSLKDLCSAARQDISEKMAAGATREEAQAPHLTDEAFENWVKELEGELNALQ